MIANLRDPLSYAVWMVPVVSARIPSGKLTDDVRT
jgi:hypothetical protein